MHAFSYHMHMHTCSGRGGGGRIRGGCGATRAAGASPGAHPIFQIITHIYVSTTCALGLGILLEP